MDAFIQAVEDARSQLIRTEGVGISMREVLRRAGYTEETRAGAAYHLNKNRVWPDGHRVPPDLVERLAKVLPISHEELVQAAQVAAGYDTRISRPDLYAVARYLEADETSNKDKDEVVATMAKIIAEEMARRRASAS